MKRVVTLVAVMALVAGSLLTFPAYLAGMVGIWGLLALLAAVNQKPLWPWLVGCLVILALKRPGFTPELGVLTGLYLLAAVVDWHHRHGSASPASPWRLVAYALTLIAATATFGVARWFASTASRTIPLDRRPIACLGDSLTDCGYPHELAKLISVPVADFGVDGISTDDGIKMLPQILATQPQLIVIELGGHDYNGGKKSRAETKANLEKLIEAFRQQEIAVVLVEIPRGFISDPFDCVERELAAKHDLQLIPDTMIRNLVFHSPLIPPGTWEDPSRRLSEDGLHPNDLGNQYLAKVVAESLTRIFGDSIRK